MNPKFRAWDSVKMKMWSPEEMGADELTLNPDGRGFVNVSGDNVNRSQYLTHMIPLQFTGLHDRTGKEIYEGDILKYSFQKKQTLSLPVIERIDPGWEIWEIKYIAPSFVYIIHSQDNSYFGELPSKAKVISLYYLSATEIIGNIYEHSHLLRATAAPSAPSEKP